MKQNSIPDLPKLKLGRYENIFNVYQTEDKKYYYNLLQSVSLPPNLPQNLYNIYTIKYSDSWPLIAYKQYGNTSLWWLILIANQIQDPTKLPEVGTNILIPIKSVADAIVKKLNQ